MGSEMCIRDRFCIVSHADTSIREVRVVWEMYYIKKGVYLTLCLWLFETSNTLSSSQNKATVDVYGICLYPQVYFEIKVYLDCYTYRRGLLRCSFRLLRAVRRPQTAGRVTGTDSRAFSFIVFTYLINEPSGSGICGYKMSL